MYKILVTAHIMRYTSCLDRLTDEQFHLLKQLIINPRSISVKLTVVPPYTGLLSGKKTCSYRFLAQFSLYKM